LDNKKQTTKAMTVDSRWRMATAEQQGEAAHDDFTAGDCGGVAGCYGPRQLLDGWRRIAAASGWVTHRGCFTTGGASLAPSMESE
jgi:hypothetical protein